MRQKLFFLLAVLFVLKAEIGYSQHAKLQVANVSFPNPMNLNVGNVGEYVYALQNIGNIHSKIDSIFFQCTANPNTVFYPIGHPVYYLTDKDTVLAKYFTIYNYPFTISSPHHNSYPLNISGLNKISSVALNTVIDSAFLEGQDTVFIHVPFFVKNCDNGYANYNFYLDTAGTLVDTVPENPYVNVQVGIPGVKVKYDTARIDTSNAAFCDSIHKHKSEVEFIYSNNGTSHVAAPPGNARIDSLRIYLYCNLGTGILDTSSFKINGVPIDTFYINHYVNGGFNIYLVDLTKYPAGSDGHPFHFNTICDMDGSGFADALAEDSSFSITATFIYDSVSCPPYKQLASSSRPNTFYLPGIWAHFNNMCFTEIYDRNPFLPFASIHNDGNYAYSSSMSAETSINAPSDILGAFDFTACPEFNQNWFPMNFGFACPDAYWTLVIPLPKGYHLNFSSPDLLLDSLSHDSIYSNIYKYLPALYDSSACSHDTSLMKAPLISEHFHIDSTQDTIFVNYGQLPIDRCSANNKAITEIPSCIKIPLILDCSAFPATTKYTQTDDMLTYQLQYICDTGCRYCPNLLTADTTVVYRHCNGGCTSIPFTEEGWSFVRTNIGDSNVNLPTYYSTCNSPTYANIAYLAKDTLPLNYSAAYPGDQIEARVTGGYGFVPSGYANEYVQIRYPALPGDPLYLFELDPTATSYFIMHGSTISGLNGVQLILPAEPKTSTNFGGVHAPVEMDFSMDSAINYYSPSLYTLWKADTNHENDTISAVIRLRVLPQSLVGGINLLNLRTEFMCKVIGPDTNVDSLHSCDSWGGRFDIYEPGTPSASLDLDSPTETSCDSLILPFRFLTSGALATVSGGDDFPYEFRPFAELDSLVIIEIPKGYTYVRSQFVAEFDAYDTNTSTNHFKGGLVYDTLPISLYYRNNNSDLTDSNTEVAFKGLSPLNPCWPIIDQKSDGSGNYSYFKILVTVKPVCYAQTPDTIYSYAGYTECTQQSDTSFQIKVRPYKSVPIILQHVNPQVNLDYPLPINNYSNLISFKFDLCDTGIYDATVPWIAIENVHGYLFNIATATIYDSNTNMTYYGSDYFNFPDSGAIFNFGDIKANKCNTLIFSAYINPNSIACPPPTGGDTGKVVVRFGNICSGTLLNPNSTTCENRVDTFYYYVYPTTLSLNADSIEPAPVSLCGGILTEYLTIKSGDLGTVSDPLFWIVPQAGDSITGITFTYPCGGSNDTTIHVPDTVGINGSGIVSKVGWNLNKDLKLHGLRGTKGLSSLSDSNTICVKVTMAMSCDYHDKPIVDSVSGISTCSTLLTASASVTPTVDSSCCPHECWAYNPYDSIFNNTSAKKLERRAHTQNFECIKVLIVGTFTVDTNFYFNGCDVSLAPNALINVVDSSNFHVVQGPCTAHSCSHVHAACDSMWRGIFVNPGSELWTIDETLIEDADTAINIMSKGIIQGRFNLQVSTFNKNWKDIVIQPYGGAFKDTLFHCVFTCRNFDSILHSSSLSCVSMGTGGNWQHAHFDTLLPPYSLPYSDMGMDIRTVGSIDISSKNTFDNLKIGIKAYASNLTVDTNTFQNIGFRSGIGVAIHDTGTNGGNNTLKVDTNIFRNCYIGVNATYYLSNVNIEFNTISDYGASPGAYGILVSSMDYVSTHDTLNIVKNTIKNFNKGIGANMNTYVNGSINYNTIYGDTCTSLNWTGIAVNEVSTPFHALYTIDSNKINVMYAGINVTGIYNSKICDNIIHLGPSCSSYLHNGGGIGLHTCDSAQIGCNVITAGFTPNTYSAIIETQSKNVSIINNSTNSAHIHIAFNGNPTTGDSLYDNTLTSGDTGIYKPSGTTMANMGSSIHATDNTFSGSFHCETATPAPLPTYHISNLSYTPSPECPLISISNITGTHHNVSCSSAPPPPRNHSMVHRGNDSITKFDSAAMVFLENTALSKDTFYVVQDTNMVIEKEGLLTTIWENPYLLGDLILKQFNDSMSNAPMGRILAIDTIMVSFYPNINYSALLNSLSSIVPANNIEANLQMAALGYLSYRLNNSLSGNQLATLRILANKCPDWDGNGVYQARALLSLFDPPSTVYSDVCGANRNDLHKPEKKIVTTTSIFNLYPNPNNGGFTLEYQLQKGQNGTFTIYDMLGKKIAVYTLNPNEEKMHINETIMDNGVYLYNIVVNNIVVKQDKLVIIK